MRKFLIRDVLIKKAPLILNSEIPRKFLIRNVLNRETHAHTHSPVLHSVLEPPSIGRVGDVEWMVLG